MTDPLERFRAAFRLNLEQQKKQAKELLKAAKASDLAALDRMRAGVPEAAEKLRQGTLKLADAQHAIARELRFANWAGLKAHIESLDDARDAILNKRGAPDSDMPTLHLRCGCDIQSVLADGGFNGDFLEVSYPYCHGPITAGPGHFEREARFLVDFAGKHMDVSYEGALARRHTEEQQLAASAANHERIVLWMEHDCFDQLLGTVEYMETLSEPALTRTPGDTRWLDTVTITDAGRAVLRGARDWLSLQPPPRWVGGILIRPGQRNWRWDEDAQRALLI